MNEAPFRDHAVMVVRSGALFALVVGGLGALGLGACSTGTEGLDPGRIDAGAIDAGAADAGPRPDLPVERVAYVSSLNGDIYAFSYDPVTGAVRAAHPSVAVGSAPGDLVVDGPRHRLHVVTESDAEGAVTTLALDPRSGVLGGQRSVGTGALLPQRMIGDHGGRWLLVGHLRGELTVLPRSREGEVGAPIHRVQLGVGIAAMAIDPSDRMVVLTDTSGRLHALRLDPSSGELTPGLIVEPASAVRGALSFHPSGRWAYALSLDLKVLRFATEAGAGGLRLQNRTVTDDVLQPLLAWLDDRWLIGGDGLSLAVAAGNGAPTIAHHPWSDDLSAPVVMAALQLDPGGRVAFGLDDEGLAVARRVGETGQLAAPEPLAPITRPRSLALVVRP